VHVKVHTLPSSFLGFLKPLYEKLGWPSKLYVTPILPLNPTVQNDSLFVVHNGILQISKEHVSQKLEDVNLGCDGVREKIIKIPVVFEFAFMGNMWDKCCTFSMTYFQPSNPIFKVDFQQQSHLHSVPSYDSKERALELLAKLKEISWFNNNYDSPIESWIHKSCSTVCPFLQTIGDIIYPQLSKLTLVPSMTEKPAQRHWDFNISLFDMMTKHRGRSHWVDMMT
jgi:hypothetical protein